MGKIRVDAWQCDFEVCGHIWLAKVEPKRCSKCKRKNWNKGKSALRKPKKTVEVVSPAKAVYPVKEEIRDAMVVPPTHLENVLPEPHAKSERCPHGGYKWLGCSECERLGQ